MLPNGAQQYVTEPSEKKKKKKNCSRISDAQAITIVTEDEISTRC